MVADITSINREDFKKDTWVLDFWADWCPPCKIMSPTFHELSKVIKEINFGSIDIQKDQSLAQKFDVMSIPTFIILKDGKEQARIVGAIPKQSFQQWIEKNK